MTTREEWIGAQGREWAARASATDAVLGPFGQEARRRLEPKPGEHLLDLGCGAADSTLRLAEYVGESGRVTGVDVSPDLIQLARSRVGEHGSITLIEADAAQHDFGVGVFDGLYSRFGCMFFGDQPAAWANLHRAMKPGGRISLVVWRALEENEWARVPLEIAKELFGEEAVPVPVAGPPEPGPFAWEDPKYFEPLLEGAGFREIVREKIEKKVPYGTGEAEDPLDRGVEFTMRIGPLARRLKGADAATRKKAAKLLRRALREFEDEDAVRMTGRAWSITGRA